MKPDARGGLKPSCLIMREVDDGLIYLLYTRICHYSSLSFNLKICEIWNWIIDSCPCTTKNYWGKMFLKIYENLVLMTSQWFGKISNGNL